MRIWEGTKWTYFFEAFSFSTRASVFTCVSAAFRKEPVLVDGVVAEHNTVAGKVKYSDAGANGHVGTVPVTDN
jgi:hypothetical protein